MVAWRQRNRPPPEDILFSQGMPPPLPTPGRITTSATSGVDTPELSFHDGYVYAAWVEHSAGPGSDVHFARWRVNLPTPTNTVSPSPTATERASDTPTSSTPSATHDTRTPTATGTDTPDRLIYLPAAFSP
jgi:hypothetical protein